MAEHVMQGAELQSMLKSNVNFVGLGGVDDETLHLGEEEMKWWRDAKFGLFVHWGVYATIGKGEWVYFNDKISPEEYRRIAMEEFRPNRSAQEITDEWLSVARDAGMKYAVMVTRHHDGFAMWDSEHSWQGFTSANYGPKADYVDAFTQSCRRYGLYTGLYYSPMDWRFPGYFDPHGEPESAQRMKEQAYGQLRELCTNYGEVKIMWYDGGWLAHNGSDGDAAWLWEPLKMNHMIRDLQPGILTTPRSGYKGDFQCDEGPREVIGAIVPIPWEKNMTISTAWGYRPNDRYWNSFDLIQMMANVICRDGNFLLNVGPDANGSVPDEAKQALGEIGEWLRENGEAVYGTRAGIWQPVDRVYGSTQKGSTVYLHVLDCAAFAECVLPNVTGKILRVELLTGKEISFLQDENGVKVYLPEELAAARRPDTILRIRMAE
ncbi:MAG: alpha-L-fucosidase [Clostridia bacterium]|nr:alpha-L-fucosidase [Clostridia bacterium]